MAEPKLGKNAGRPAASGTRKPRTPGRIAASVFKWIGVLALTGIVLGGVVFAVIYARTPVPDANTEFQTNVTRVTYRDGTTDISTFAVQNRVTIPLDQMSQYARDAIVAAENETFWTDPGISVVGLARAVQTALTPGVDTVGGSTITQQYVKVLYLTQDKSLTRKLNEIVISLKLAREKSKEDILEGYLNTVYFGRGAYGIQAASQAYFGIDASELDLPQSVALTSIINSPNNLDPAKGDKQRADLVERYQYALNQMVKTGVITDAQRTEVYTTLPDFPALTKESRLSGPRGFLMNMAKDELLDKGFTAAQIEGGGLTIVTTIDEKAQEAAVAAAQRQRDRIAAAQRQDPMFYNPALASVDTTNGAIIALYGGPDFTSATNSINWATTARYTGSTFKPWALVAALRQGASLGTMLNGDTFVYQGETIKNIGGRNYGPVTLESATTRSLNAPYVDLVRQLPEGPLSVTKAAVDAGLTAREGWDDPAKITVNVALGYAETSPLDAARGMATLINGGVRSETHIVAEVKDAQGQLVYQAQNVAEQTVEPDVAQTAVSALTKVVRDGTGSAVRGLGYPVAGKTGTYFSDGKTQATWFIGGTKQIATAFVLTAGNDGLQDLGARTYGSTYAAVGWLDYMKVAQQGMERITFPGPAITRATGKFTPPPRPAPKPTPKPKPTVTAQPEPKESATPEPPAPASSASATPEASPSTTPRRGQPRPSPSERPDPGNR